MMLKQLSGVTTAFDYRDDQDPLLFNTDDVTVGAQTTVTESVELRARGGRTALGGGRHASSSSRDCSWESGASTSSTTTTIERRRRPSDTLQNMALRYHTTVSELKRANGLMSEQEFYGLALVRIPVSKFSPTVADDADEQTPAPSTSTAKTNAIMVESTELLIPLEVAGGENTARTKDNRYELPPFSQEITDDDGDEDATERQAHFTKLINQVDASLIKGKNTVAQLQQQQLDEDADVNWHFVYASEPRSDGFLERTIRHYLLMVLCLFLFIGIPLGFIFYKAEERFLDHSTASKRTN